MNLTLSRTDYRSDGVFGNLITTKPCFVTLEHAYEASAKWLPKLPAGIYVCVRGTHQLEHGDPFETFEITGVAGHSGILFHPGNKNQDSAGCVLLGEYLSKETPWGIINSRVAFQAFMKLQSGLDQFILQVRA